MPSKAKTLVSIINWNNNQATIACLESLARILPAGQPDIRLIDNHSEREAFTIPDETLAKLHSIEIIRNQANKGFAGAHNDSLRHALENGYKIVYLLNNDTELISGTLFDELEIALNASPEVLAAAPTILSDGSGTVWFAGGDISKFTGAPKHRHVGLNVRDLPMHDSESVSFLTGCCLAIRVDNLRNFGEFLNEDYFMYWEDADWCAKAQKAGFKLLYAPTAQILHNVSSSLGIRSPLYTYYIIRNNVLFLKRHVKLLFRLMAYARVALVSCKYFLKTLLASPAGLMGTSRALLYGWTDGLRQRGGKYDERKLS